VPYVYTKDAKGNGMGGTPVVAGGEASCGDFLGCRGAETEALDKARGRLSRSEFGLAVKRDGRQANTRAHILCVLTHYVC